MNTFSQRIVNLSQHIITSKDILMDLTTQDILTPDKLNLKIEEIGDEITQLARDTERQKKVAEEKKTIVFYGKYSTGKTTLINALLSARGFEFPQFPMKDDPTTAKPVRFTFSSELEGNQIEATLIYENGNEERVKDEKRIMESMTTSEEQNSNKIQEIEIQSGHPFLLDFDLLDLPGTGTAFFKSHETIVRSRLRDGTVIIWLSGGPDEMFPEIDDKELLRELIDENARKVIPVWNRQQKKGIPLDEDENKEEYINKSDTSAKKLDDEYVTGVVDIPTIKVWAHEALINRNEGWEERTGIQELYVKIEDVSSNSLSSKEIAQKSLFEIKRKSIEMIRTSIGYILQSMDEIHEEKSNVRKALRKLDFVLFDSYDVIKKSAEDLGYTVAEEKIMPVLKSFVEAETSPGGVIHTSFTEFSKTIKGLFSGNFLKKVKEFSNTLSKNVEIAAKKRLEQTLSLSEKQGWLDQIITQTCEDVSNNLNRKWSLFSGDLANLGFDHIENISGMGDEFIEPPDETLSNLAGNVKQEILRNLTSLSAAMATAVTVIILALLPPEKTGTPVDIVLVAGGLIVGVLVISSLKKRMLSRVRMAAFECNIHIRQIIRKPLKESVRKIERFWNKVLDLSIVDEKVRQHNNFIGKLRNIISNILELDF